MGAGPLFSRVSETDNESRMRWGCKGHGQQSSRNFLQYTVAGPLGSRRMASSDILMLLCWIHNRNFQAEGSLSKKRREWKNHLRTFPWKGY